ALGQATAQLRAQLGESLSSIRQSDQPLEQAMTASIQALRAYSAGYKLNVSGRIIESIPFMKRAAELDPQFTGAYDHLVISCWGTEQPEAAAEPYRWLALSLIRLNRFAEAKDTLTQASQLKLGLTHFYTELYQLAFIQSAGADVAGMQKELDWAKGKPDEYVA